MLAALIAGLGLGVVIAAQIGPVSLLCVRTVLRCGLAPGLAMGAGAAIVDTAYGGLGMLGAAQLLRASAVRVSLGMLGAAVLVWLGARTLAAARRVRLDVDEDEGVPTPLAAFRVSLLTTVSNPSTIAYWATAFAAASTAALTTSTGTSVALLAGVGLGTACWFTFLACGVALARGRVGDRAARIADAVAGVGIIGFGVLLGIRTLAST